MGLEHQVELAGLGERAVLAAVRAGVRVVELVEAEALLAVGAVDERVGEVGEVAARLPHRRRAEDRRVDEDDVVALLDHRPHPGVAHVAQHQRAERAVVVGAAEAAVDLRRREHEAAPLGEVDDLVELGGGHGPPGYGGRRFNSGTGSRPPFDPDPVLNFRTPLMATPRWGVNDPSRAALFGRQFGVATAAQSMALGVSRRSIGRARRTGTLVGVLPGLYRLAGQAMVFDTRAMIAQLHLGASAFLDGTTAGVLHRLRSMPQSLIQATVVGRVTRATPSWIAGIACGDGARWRRRRCRRVPGRPCTAGAVGVGGTVQPASIRACRRGRVASRTRLTTGDGDVPRSRSTSAVSLAWRPSTAGWRQRWIEAGPARAVWSSTRSRRSAWRACLNRGASTRCSCSRVS